MFNIQQSDCFQFDEYCFDSGDIILMLATGSTGLGELGEDEDLSREELSRFLSSAQSEIRLEWIRGRDVPQSGRKAGKEA